MDEKRAMEIISELENQLRETRRERDNYLVMISNYQAFVKCVPNTLPGIPDEISPYNWIKWAKRKLGYD